MPAASQPGSQAALGPSRRALSLAVIGLLVVAAIVVAAGVMSRQTLAVDLKERAETQAVRSVVVIAPLPAGASAALDLPGRTEAWSRAPIYARVSGYLKAWNADIGASVKAGQLLAEIDPAPYEVALQQATGALARDEALLRNARVDLERFRTLLAQDSIARQQVDTQEALVRQYEGTLLANRAQVDNAKLQLSYTRITAPIGGRAGLRLVDAGNLIRAGDTTGLVTLAQIAPITVVFPIPEDSLPPVLAQLKAGARLRVEAWDRSNLNRLATGVLLTADNQIDTQTGTVRLKAQFANADGALFPNQFVNVRLKLDRLEDAILVPPAAIQRGREGTFVYALDEENRVRVVPVKPGPSTPEQVAVEGELAAGTRVVIDGADRLRPGMRVEVADRSGQGKGGQGRRDGAKKGDSPAGAAK